MTERGERTFQTSLSDDELTLFDALFDVWDTFESLLPENFRSWHNLSYDHGLDATSLEGRIHQLLDNGLLRSRVERTARGEITWLALTEHGGGLWEQERRPVWDRYCTDACWPGESDDAGWVLSVRSPDLATARAFLRIATLCGLYDVDPRQLPVETKSLEELIPWRTFEMVYELRVPVSPPAPDGRLDWALYERNRSWWRNVPELGSFAA